MIDYRAGDWGFHVAFGIQGSLAPRAFVMAIPNALLTLLIATLLLSASPDSDLLTEDTTNAAQLVIAAVTPIMIFILYNRSRTSYDRWWEGGTLLQKTRGEWFNAYSSIMAFTSTKPELQDQVDAYVHLLTRLMSLLMCCGLQQVSPERDRPFEIFDLDGIEPASMEFLNAAPDKVEIILQWIQRSMVVHQQTGVLPVAPPILSRAFQEVSRGIVNLQNARKIADFPYPYPLAQISMILQLLHWAATPFAAALALPRGWAVAFSFCTMFVLWCIHFNALDLEFPFGSRVNDLPMQEFQQEWNNSICTLVAKRATRPPKFDYDPVFHDGLSMVMSDASDLYVPKSHSRNINRRKIAVIKVSDNKSKTLDAFNEDHQQLSERTTNVPRRRDTHAPAVAIISDKPAAAANSIGKPEPAKRRSSAILSSQLNPQRSASNLTVTSMLATIVNSETSAEKDRMEVTDKDIVVSAASMPKAENDTIPSNASAAQTSQAARNRACRNRNMGAVLSAVRPIKPLVLEKTQSPSSTSDAPSSARENDESSDERTSPDPLFDSEVALHNAGDNHNSNQEPVDDANQESRYSAAI